MGHTVDLTGKKFFKLTVIRKAKEQTQYGNVLWECVCECGGKTIASSRRLNIGNKKTCGCAKSKAYDKNGQRIPYEHPLFTNASRIMCNAKKTNTPFGFKSSGEFVSYLLEIYPDKCPVFGEKLKVGENGKHHNMSPSIDKIIPSKGYVRGNIQVMSYLANRMKNNATPKQLKQFAQWVLKGE